MSMKTHTCDEIYRGDTPSDVDKGKYLQKKLRKCGCRCLTLSYGTDRMLHRDIKPSNVRWRGMENVRSNLHAEWIRHLLMNSKADASIESLPIVAGTWKMNKTVAEAHDLVSEMSGTVARN